MSQLKCAKRVLAAVISFAVLLSLVFSGGAVASWVEEDGYYGDVNFDGKVGAADALLCLQHAVKLMVLDGEAAIVADVDGNGVIGSYDALLILQMTVNLIDRFPIYVQNNPDNESEPSSSEGTVTSQESTPGDPSEESKPTPPPVSSDNASDEIPSQDSSDTGSENASSEVSSDAASSEPSSESTPDSSSSESSSQTSSENVSSGIVSGSSSEASSDSTSSDSSSQTGSEDASSTPSSEVTSESTPSDVSSETTSENTSSEASSEESSAPPSSSVSSEPSSGSSSSSSAPSGSGSDSSVGGESSSPSTPSEASSSRPSSSQAASSKPTPSSTTSPGITSTPGFSDGVEDEEDWTSLEIDDFGYTAIQETQYYCYPQLTEEQQGVYDIIHQNSLSMTEGRFRIGDRNVSQADIRLVYAAYTNDHPEVFWLPKGYVYSTSETSTYLYFNYEDKLDYLYDKALCASMEEELKASVKKAFQEALVPGLTAAERELRLHDWLAGYCTYNDNAVTAPDDYPEAFTSYGALVTRTAVCEGFSRAFQLLCYYAGIPCTLVEGTAHDVPHMWNAVDLDHDWYLVDVAWDAGSKIIHTFYNQTEIAMGYSHKLSKDFTTLTEEELANAQSLNFVLPSFNHTEYSYHRLFGALTTLSEAPTDLADQVAYRVNQGDRIVEIMVVDAVFHTADDAAGFISDYITDIVSKLTVSPRPKRYSISISVDTNCLILEFIY